MTGLEERFIGDINTEKIELYSQKIFDCRTGNKSKIAEILCREHGKGVGEKLLKLDGESKVTFDFFVLNKFFELFKDISGTNSTFNINIDPKTIIHPTFKQDMNSIFLKYNFGDFQQLSIEITENGYFNQQEIIILNENILFLRNKGIKVGIDDYPNDNNNNELIEKIDEVDFIKIDKNFIISYINGSISKDKFLATIEKLIKDIRERMGKIPIVIEGIETLEIFDLIKDNFCDEITFLQGYYFHYPEIIINNF